MKIFRIFLNSAVLYCSVSILLVSCHRPGHEDGLLSYFDSVPTVSLRTADIIELEQFGILSPTKIICQGDLFVIKKTKSENYVDILTPERTIISCIKKGRGPGELIDVGSIQVQDDKLFVFGRSQRKLIVVDIPGTVASRKQSILEERIMGAPEMAMSEQISLPVYLQLYKNHIYSIGMFGDNSLVVELSQSGDPFSGIPAPVLEDARINDLAQRILNASALISISPDGTKIAAAYNQIAALSFADTQPGLKQRWANIFFQPELWFPEDNPGIVVGFSRENISAFHDLQAFDDIVYALYSGKNHMKENEDDPSLCNYLLVYDWNGHPIIKYELEQSISGFCVEGDSLYGVSQTPNARLFRFGLN